MSNGVMMQFFQWYDPWGGVLWDRLRAEAPNLARDGFTAVWIPPAPKGSGGEWDVGYGVYDLFDLGEFPQKQTTRTKYGTRAQLLAAINAARGAGLQVYADVVFNHKDGGDGAEDVLAYEVDWDDRNRTIAGPYFIKAWTNFRFPGRGGAYSTYEWHWYHFDAVSFDQNHPDRGNANYSA